jgi:NADH-quinone oxidoreductase subunit N
VIAALLAATVVIPHIDYWSILPELILIGGALVVLGVSSLFVEHVPTSFYSASTVLISLAALLASLRQWVQIERHGPYAAIAQSISVDGFSVLFLILVCVVLVLSALLADGYLRREGAEGPEFYVLAMLSGSGAMLMAAAGDLIVIFLGLEILSIALYVLAGMDARRNQSLEAAMKYFILGAFSSAIFVYGIALTYGATGSTNLAQIAAYLAHNPSPTSSLLLAGLGLLLVGFGFKVAAVPFHMWTPDVYQGAPTPVTGFMASVAKAGGFAGLLRVFFDSFSTLRLSWEPMIWALAVVTLLTGAILALVQRDIKRMMAYSSINHAGFILLGLQAASVRGIEGSLYYLFAYAVIVVGTFGVIALVGGKGDRSHDLNDYRGLGRRQPLLALAFAVLLMAQAGIPFTTGFLSKFYVIAAAVAAHSYALAVIAMLSAAIAAFFYLRVIAVMYGGAGDGAPTTTADVAAEIDAGAVEVHQALEQGAEADARVAVLTRRSEPVEVAVAASDRIEIPFASAAAIAMSIGVTVVFGVWPQPLFDFAHAARLLF